MLPCSLMSFLSYPGRRQKQRAAPADHHHGSQPQLHLVPFKDLMPSVTLPNCLTPPSTPGRPQTSWPSYRAVPRRTPSVTLMRMCPAHTRRAALWPTTSMRPARLRVGAAAVRLVGWKTRSTDNAVNRSLSGLSRVSVILHCSQRKEHYVLHPCFLLCTILAACVV